ncbi:MAG: hypothetical protein JRH13_07735 [Deltaproteobacteria bacterium]|nr:hypothetical protein [Deltaproteobacteria bacterium]MBW2017723.1 hypothetical protein [Deltaproteobacteria bacterium]MBW2129242.1 hypothetical protein [Deltaproteobacteria bacterium]MBW2303472.1 hypothetical protein [Deltaproteobacteria bacterium]
MGGEERKPFVEIHMDPKGLYLEETYTDGKTGAIHRLSPVKPDGTPDEDREVLFMGNTQLMAPDGRPVPIQCAIEASNLAEAVENFPDAVNRMVGRLMAEAEEGRNRE